MLKLFKRSVALVVALAFALSFVSFAVLAETQAEPTAKITGDNKLRGYFTGASDKLSSCTNTAKPSARDSSGSNRRITYFQYNVSDYLKYAGTEFDFSLRIGGPNSDEKAYCYDLYLVKGTYVDVTDGVATTMLNMNCMINNSLVSTTEASTDGSKFYPLIETSDLLIKVGSFKDINGKRADTKTYSVTEAQLKSAVGANGWVTFIINATGNISSQQYFNGDHDGSYLGVTYDQNSVYEDKTEPALTVEGGVATAKVDVTNATAQDVSYKHYLAEYNNEELIQLVPMDMNALKYFKTSETLTANVSDGNKVKFFVWSADGITPVVVAPEK